MALSDQLTKCRTIILFVLISLSGSLQAAIITVNSSSDAALPDDNGNCTLREAIEAAETNSAVDACEAGSGADTIEFIPSIEEIELSAGNLSDFDNPIRQSLTIVGPENNKLDIYGDNLFSFFYLDSFSDNQTFRFSNLRLYESLADRGGAIRIENGETVIVENVEFNGNTATNGGGAIFLANATTRILLTVRQSTFDGNRAQGPTSGGAIRTGNNAIVGIERSTFVDNQSLESNGGAISAFSNHLQVETRVRIDHSTFSGNLTNNAGGALSIAGAQEVEVTNSTFVGNIANADENNTGGIENGGGIFVSSSTSLIIKNSIFSNEDRSTLGVVADDIYQVGAAVIEPITSLGFNFIRNNNGVNSYFPSGFPNANNDYVGTSTNPITPSLTPLEDHGGPTRTHRPNTLSSPANAGSCSDILLDQRGFGNPETFRRPLLHPEATLGPGSDGCDIGAVESFAEELVFPKPEEDLLCVAIQASNGNIVSFCL